MWKIFYNSIIVPLLWLSFQLGAKINDKIRRGLEGRRGLFESLERAVAQLQSPVRIWFHSSSMGEFEQAKPIISAIRHRFPDVDIIVTFFSPSGYEHSRTYKLANIISYIPFDSRAQTDRFLDLMRPTIAVMVRYDIWPNMMWGLHKRGVLTLIANATMKKDSTRKLPFIRNFHTSVYDCLSYILAVSDDDKQSFGDFKLHYPIIESVGDTRFDQVLLRHADALKRQIFPSSIIAGKQVFVIGQSWEADDEVLFPVVFKLHQDRKNLLTIIVPHEPTEEYIEHIEYQLRDVVTHIRLSEVGNYNGEQVILIDSIGVLVALYQYAHIAYVGGSFKQGIHNVLEPAVFGIPVVYGPKHTNSQEAVILAKNGGGFVIEDERELYRTMRTLLDNDKARLTAGAIARTMVEQNSGATERCMRYIEPYLKPH